MEKKIWVLAILAMGSSFAFADTSEVRCEVTGHYKKLTYWSMDYPAHYYPLGWAHPYFGHETLDVTYQEVFGAEPMAADAASCLQLAKSMVGAEYQPPYAHHKATVLWGTMEFESGLQTIRATIDGSSLRLRSVETDVVEYNPEAVNAVHALVTSVGKVSDVSYKVRYKARKDKLVIRARADLE